MLAVTRCVVPEADRDDFVAAARAALDALSGCSGFLDGQLGRSTDDPGLFALVTRWQAIGSYRRGLSSYDVKLAFAPLMGFVVDEPGGYEVLADGGDGPTSAPE